MNIISWNVRGLGSDPTFREAQRMLRMHKPNLVFLCETKLTSRQMQEKCQKLNFENCFEVSRIKKKNKFSNNVEVRINCGGQVMEQTPY
ncbi:hypothetical protein AB3S75_015518 [Citrus x aurantiifolia]